MKSKLFLMIATSVIITSCIYKVDGIYTSNDQALLEIRLDGSVNSLYGTRLYNGGFSDKDQIGLYGVNYINNNSTKGKLVSKGNQVDNALYSYDEESNTWISNGTNYYKDAETNIDLYAYYPYGHPEDVNNYIFEVKSDQTAEGIYNGYSLSDFLWGVEENITPTNNKVIVHFSHRLSCSNVILKEGEGFEEGEFDSLKKSVIVKNTKHSASINLATGQATAFGELSPEGIAMYNTEEGFKAIVVPQSIAANTILYAITLDGVTYKFKLDKVVTFRSGKQSKFTIKVDKKEITGEYELSLVSTEIVDWITDIETHIGEARQYYVVQQDTPGMLSKHIRDQKKNANKIKNLKITGKINVRDLYFMRDSMDILQAVNLKETTIEPGWSWSLYSNTGTAHHLGFNGEMPATHEEQLNVLRAEYPHLKNLEDYGFGAAYSTYKDEIPKSAFQNKKTLVYFSFPEKIIKIDDYAFDNTMLSGALIIPNDVIEIGERAFAATNIYSLEMSHNLNIIGNYAFSDCNSLSGTLAFPEHLEKIGAGAFYNCSILSGILAIPSTITNIPRACFFNCGFTGDLIIPEGIIKIESEAFSFNTNLNGTLSLPKSLKEVEDLAFQRCKFQGELVIPSQIQKIPRFCFAYNEFSSVVFLEDSELIMISDNAFYGNWRISEPIIFPKDLLTIGASAFSDCKNIPKLKICSNVNTIGNAAFAGCFGITNIIIDVVIPPTLGSNVFDGVGKDNLTLEVPDQSVTRYQSTLGWNDFLRISAHCDFSISKSLMRVLNGEYSKQYILRVPANHTWSIKSKPEWVKITPSSGTGKTEVTISVDQLPDEYFGEFEIIELNEWGVPYTTKYQGRSGDIVFSLNDKDYTSTMKVEQYNYSHYDGEVIINQRASKGKGVNIVFMGDCFDARDIAMGKYLDGINKAIGHYFDIEPYKTYKNYFNIYTIIGMSDDSGVGTVNTIKESKFGSQYTIDSGVIPNETITFEYAMKAETINNNNINQSLVVMVENTTDYGGVCYMWYNGSAIAVCPMSSDAYPYDFRGIVQHEAGGHGFAKLADEYIYHNTFIDNCDCDCCEHSSGLSAGKSLGWYRNLSTNGDLKTVEWSHLIFHPNYSNIVDMFEGGYYHSRGIYRSESVSCMNNNIPYFSAIQRQEIVERIKRYAGEEFSIEEFYANDVLDASNNIGTRSQELSIIEKRNAGKQRPPQIMGDRPKLN